jgi:hypothetical protein
MPARRIVAFKTRRAATRCSPHLTFRLSTQTGLASRSLALTGYTHAGDLPSHLNTARVSGLCAHLAFDNALDEALRNSAEATGAAARAAPLACPRQSGASLDCRAAAIVAIGQARVAPHGLSVCALNTRYIYFASFASVLATFLSDYRIIAIGTCMDALLTTPATGR